MPSASSSTALSRCSVTSHLPLRSVVLDGAILDGDEQIFGERLDRPIVDELAPAVVVGGGRREHLDQQARVHDRVLVVEGRAADDDAVGVAIRARAGRRDLLPFGEREALSRAEPPAARPRRSRPPGCARGWRPPSQTPRRSRTPSAPRSRDRARRTRRPTSRGFPDRKASSSAPKFDPGSARR